MSDISLYILQRLRFPRKGVSVSVIGCFSWKICAHGPLDVPSKFTWGEPILGALLRKERPVPLSLFLLLLFPHT
jgi:hypothetical protein